MACLLWREVILETLQFEFQLRCLPQVSAELETLWLRFRWRAAISIRRTSEPQRPLLHKKVSQYTNLYCSTPRSRIGVLLAPYTLKKGEYCQYSSHCIAMCLPFVLRYASHSYRSAFRKILVAVCGHRDVPHLNRDFVAIWHRRFCDILRCGKINHSPLLHFPLPLSPQASPTEKHSEWMISCLLPGNYGDNSKRMNWWFITVSLPALGKDGTTDYWAEILWEPIW